MDKSLRSTPFLAFKGVYEALAATPLRRIPGMLSLSNVFFRLIWPGGHVIDVQGNKMYIDVNDPNPNMRKTFQAYGMNLIHEEETTALFKKIVKPGDVVLDLGANIGYFTILAARLVGPKGKVFSFEPEPTNFHYLTKNIEVNNYTNAFAYQKAVADKAGTTQLYVCSYDSGHHTIHQYEGIDAYRRGRQSNMRSVPIDTIAIDNFLQDKTDRVDIIKMDVEGAEALALNGMKGTLQRNPHIKIFLEYFPLLMKKMGSSPETYAQSLLNDFGFSVYAIGHDYAMVEVGRSLVQIKSVNQLMDFIEQEDDHVNLFLTRETLPSSV
jgi:FkbM family methyltransferase